MDWSLFSRKTKYPFLRKELALKEAVWSYYVASVVNVLLRFSWVIYLAPEPDVQLQGFIVPTIEVVRRVIWNVYRVESEHTGNVDGYRVTRDVPLPYVTPRDAGNADVYDGNDDLLDGAQKQSAAGPQTARQRFFGFFHGVHKQVVDEFRPLASIRLPSLHKDSSDDDEPNGGVAAGKKKARARDYESRHDRKRSKGTAPDSSSSERDPIDDLEDDDESDIAPAADVRKEDEHAKDDTTAPHASGAQESSQRL